MFRLMTMLFGMIATSLMGTGIIIVLAMGKGTWIPISIAAGTGFLLAIPVSWYTARQMIGKFSS